MTQEDIAIIERVLIPQGVDYDKPYISPHNLDTVLKYVLDNQNKTKVSRKIVEESVEDDEPESLESNECIEFSRDTKHSDISQMIDNILADLAKRPKPSRRRFC